MSNLEDRQKAFENKYMLDEEVRFKATASAIKTVATEAATHIGHSDAVAYAVSIVGGVLLEEGPRAALDKILADAAAKGRAIDANALQSQFEKAHLAAMQKLMQG